MKRIINYLKKNAASLLLLALPLAVASCSTTGGGFSGRNYNPPAYRPSNPSAVSVKVSTGKQMVYVMEGSKPLLVTACCVGMLGGHSTPLGNFRAFNKIAKKRSGSYGFAISNGQIVSCTAGNAHGQYVGYPMPYWVEFTSAYGFHQGFVWPVPHTHGCIRLHKNAAPKFFALVHEGTPINIASSQPEDATLGANHVRPTDYADPDPPASLMVSDAAFAPPAGPLFAN